MSRGSRSSPSAPSRQEWSFSATTSSTRRGSIGGRSKTRGARTSAQLDSLARRYRGDTAAVPLRGRTAIIVDDGLATGATATAAVRSIRRDEPARVVVAVPVCAVDTATALRGEADTVICLGELQGFRAVGLHYDDFAAVSDDVVREALERAEARGDGARAR